MIRWFLLGVFLLIVWMGYPIVCYLRASMKAYRELLRKGRARDDIFTAFEDERIRRRFLERQAEAMARVYTGMLILPGVEALIMLVPTWLELFLFWPFSMEEVFLLIEALFKDIERETDPRRKKR